MKNHLEIETIRHHTSPVKSIGVIRNNFNLDFITSCHDQINLWRLDEGITLLRFGLLINTSSKLNSVSNPTLVISFSGRFLQLFLTLLSYATQYEFIKIV